MKGYGQQPSCYFFFFQAEDGIRDLTVTGVQTCALPIFLDGHGISKHKCFGAMSAGANAVDRPPARLNPHKIVAEVIELLFDTRLAGFANSHHANHGSDADGDRKSTRLNSSHSQISYAVFCLKKNTNLTLYSYTLRRE